MSQTINQLITDNLDIWTSAIKKRKAVGRGSSKKQELYGIKKLRELILELAVRGKLVPQDPSDEPASVLLERIKQEKERLVKDKKIKKPKKLPEISDDEKPFELPNGWEWSRLGNYSFIFSGNAFKSNDFSNELGIKSIKITNAGVGKLIETNDYLPLEFLEKYDAYKIIKDDLILALTRPYISDGLKISMCPTSYHNSLLNQRVAAIRTYEYPNYVFLNLRSPYILNAYKNKFGGNGLQPNLKMSDVTDLILAIPPITEQHHIVAKVDELMLLCDQLEQQTESSIETHKTLVAVLLNTLTESKDAQQLKQNWACVSEFFDTLFTTEHSIDQLKQTILQLAVMGKLVPQDPSDEPASKLLDRIAAEKAQLIADKNLSTGRKQKQKALPPITEEEKPFELPNGWEWCKFGLLSEFINGDRGKNYPNKSEYVEDGIPWINTGHIEPEGNLTTINMNYITQEKFNSLRGGKVQKGDLVYCLRGATFGKTAFVEPYNHGAIASSLMIIRPYHLDLNSYIYRYLVSPFGRTQIFRFDNGSAQPNLSANSVTLYAVPLPPLEEQKRIVIKVEELLKICDQLKSNLNQAQQTQLNLTDAVVEKAV